VAGCNKVYPDGFLIHWIIDDMLGTNLFKNGSPNNTEQKPCNPGSPLGNLSQNLGFGEFKFIQPYLSYLSAGTS
jgi:hypothetical protein